MKLFNRDSNSKKEDDYFQKITSIPRLLITFFTFIPSLAFLIWFRYQLMFYAHKHTEIISGFLNFLWPLATFLFSSFLAVIIFVSLQYFLAFLYLSIRDKSGDLND